MISGSNLDEQTEAAQTISSKKERKKLIPFLYLKLFSFFL